MSPVSDSSAPHTFACQHHNLIHVSLSLFVGKAWMGWEVSGDMACSQKGKWVHLKFTHSLNWQRREQKQLSHKLLCVSVAALLTCVIHVCLSLCTSYIPSIFSHGLYPFHESYLRVYPHSCFCLFAVFHILARFSSPPPHHLYSRPFNKSVILMINSGLKQERKTAVIHTPNFRLPLISSQLWVVAILQFTDNIFSQLLWW